MTEHEILVAARALIAEPEHWTQEVFARDADGVSVITTHPRARCWCSEGAIAHVCSYGGEWDSPSVNRAIIALLDEMPMGIPGFNDTHTHAEVLSAFDRAITATEET